jgi:hypothetical protein
VFCGAAHGLPVAPTAIGALARRGTEGVWVLLLEWVRLLCGGGREGIRHAIRMGAAARTTHQAEEVVGRKGTARAATPRTIVAHTKARASSRTSTPVHAGA